MSAGAGRDTRLYSICDPLYGDRGPSFTRVFSPAFIAGLGKQRDKFTTIKRHLAGSDPGAVPPSTAAQLAAAAGHANAAIVHQGAAAEARESANAFVQRSDELISLIRAHVENAALRKDMDTMVAKHEAGAADAVQLGEGQNPPIYSPGHPSYIAPVAAAGGNPAVLGAPLVGHDLEQYQKYGNSLARHVWGICVNAGSEKSGGLTSLAQTNSWANAKLSSVTFGARSIEDLASLLDTLSNERQAGPYTEEEMRIKFLSLIVTPPDLFKRATDELQHCSVQWRTGGALTGTPSYRETVKGMSELWACKLLKVMLSSSESEIGAGTIAVKRAIYVRHFIGFIDPLPTVAISHIVDNSALPALTENLGVSRKTEHFRRWLHFMRYAVLHGYVYVHLAKTTDMHANALTKVENLSAFLIFRKIAMNL
jgi:hypothetical protein